MAIVPFDSTATMAKISLHVITFCKIPSKAQHEFGCISFLCATGIPGCLRESGGTQEWPVNRSNCTNLSYDRPNTNPQCDSATEVNMLATHETLQSGHPSFWSRMVPGAPWLMKLITSVSFVQTDLASGRSLWLELKRSGTLALLCPIADRNWAKQASGTQKF